MKKINKSDNMVVKVTKINCLSTEKKYDKNQKKHLF